MKAEAKPKDKKETKKVKESVPKGEIGVAVKKAKSPQPKKEKTPKPKREKSPQPKKEKSPQPKEGKNPQPEKEKSLPKSNTEEPESKEVKPKSEEVKKTIENKKAGPIDHLPMGSFDLEAWKRFYSNNDEQSSCDYFWREFDPSCYSIWRADYRFNSELNQVFMSCNLMGGMLQRLDKMTRHAFASCCLWGEAGNL